jgi:hypothetical protein
MPDTMLNSEARQRVYSNGLRGSANWIDRQTADLIRALFKSHWRTTGELDRLWSVNREALNAEGLSADFLVVADQVFATYGTPELEPSARARTISERSMAKPQTRGGARPATGGHLTTPEGSTRLCHAPETDSAPLDPNREFGFQPRQ